MNSLELMTAVLEGQSTPNVPVAPHWWGEYKFVLAQKAGLLRPSGAQGLARIDLLFYQTFCPDWFHLGAGSPHPDWSDPNKPYRERLVPQLRKMNSEDVVAEFVQASALSPQAILNSGIYDHVRMIAADYGGDVFIAVNEGNPICSLLDPCGILGFYEGMEAMLQAPELMHYLIAGLYEAQLAKIDALAEIGCHAYIGSETYCGADMLPPGVYRELVFPAQKGFYEGVRARGLEPITYFLGDVSPRIPEINDLGVSALMVEESKKGFTVDVVDIRQRLSSDITLFGNIDSVYTLDRGTLQDVDEEIAEQMNAAQYGRFILANGSPLTPDTNEENLHHMISMARSFSMST